MMADLDRVIGPGDRLGWTCGGSSVSETTPTIKMQDATHPHHGLEKEKWDRVCRILEDPDMKKEKKSLHQT